MGFALASLGDRRAGGILIRTAAAALVILAALVGGGIVTGSVSRGEGAKSPRSAAKAIAELDALREAESSYYTQRGRYSGRLADLFATTRSGTDIVMNAGGLDIHLDVSSDGQTVIVRVNSAAIALSTVLVGGKETGRTCEALAEGAFCP